MSSPALLKPCFPNLAVLLLAGLVVCNSGCSDQRSARLDSGSSELNSESTASMSTASISKAAAQSASDVSSAASAPKPDAFQQAVERAASASRIGQSAQSRDDWRLVANRWQQAIALMKTVPTTSPNRMQAQQKLAQYQQKLAYAQQQANRPTAAINPDGVVLLPPSPAPLPLASRSTTPLAAAPQTAVSQAAVPQGSEAQQPAPQATVTAPSSANRRFYAPIVRREGNTPVIRVMFNRKQLFDMIVDTGASGTLITRQMASQLGVVTVAQANVDTASQRSVTFPLGYVQSVAVGDAVASNLLVAVAGPDLDVGLLGHDFFGNYDVMIREREVVFQER